MSIQRQTKNHIVHKIICTILLFTLIYCVPRIDTNIIWKTLRTGKKILFELIAGQREKEREREYRFIQQKHFNIDHWNFLSFRWKCEKWPFDLFDLDLWPWLMKKQHPVFGLRVIYYVDFMLICRKRPVL